MATQYPDFSQIVRESACSMLNDPGALSEFIVARTLERGNHGMAINIQDARELIKDYLNVLCENR